MARRCCLLLWAPIAGISLAIAWALLDVASVQGQFQVRPVGPARRAADADQAHVQPPTDRTLSRGIQLAEESLARGEFAQATRFLDDVLGRPEDVFVETGADGEFAGLKTIARRMIGDLPPEGRATYETAYAPVAERALRMALAAGDMRAIDAIAQRYFYTPAGAEAALITAIDASDAGRHMAAALLYDQLLETPAAAQRFEPELSVRAAASWLSAGEASRAEAILARLVERGEQKITVGGEPRRLEPGADLLAWLRSTIGEPANDLPKPRREWATYRGNAARSGETRGGLPHMRVRWSVRLMGHPRLERLFEDYAANLARSEQSLPVAGAPLAAGDYVLVRTPDGLLAVDFRTGKRVWRTEPERDREMNQLVRGSDERGAFPEAVRSFARRMWDDYLYGLASSDGERVFVIRDLPLPPVEEYEFSPWMGGAALVEPPAASNRLCAYDLATQGKLVWEIVGNSAQGELAGAFFLGAPLAVGPSAYALVEIKDAVYLAALDRTTGKLQWRQLLAHLEAGVTMDLSRRLQAAMPSYADGMLVCPTGAGLVVGIDLSKRSLAWAHRYPTERNDAAYRGVAPEGASFNRWTDAAATVAGDAVLLTPPESQELFCLDLRTGKLRWRAPRGTMQRLACVHDDVVLLAGSRELNAVRLSDGKPAWPAALRLPGNAMASGAGFLSAGQYYLPVSTAEVLAIDVRGGQIVGQAAARQGEALGNLICHRGSVISQNGLFLDCFDQVEALRQRSTRRLARDARDAEALRTLGEVAYNEGRLSESLDLLARAYRAAPDDLLARDVLAECLASALDEDFAAFQSYLPLLAELQDGVPARRLDLLRIESQGRLESGDPLAAARACVELYRLGGTNEEPLELGRDLEAQAPRWVAAQLDAAWRTADAEDRKAIEELARSAIAAGDAADNDELGRFLDFFGALPMAEPLKLARAVKLIKERRELEAHLLLLETAASENREIRRESTARLADLLHQAAERAKRPGLHALAADFDRRLRTEFADEACLDGATGRELAARWEEKSAPAPAEWPRGRVEVTSVAASADPTGRFRTPMRIVRWERADGVLASIRALASAPARGGGLVLEDGVGSEIFRVALEPASPNEYRPPGNAYGVAHGCLCVLSLGRQLVAVNTLADPEGSTPAVLWRAPLANHLEPDQTYFDEAGGGGARRPGSFRPGRSLDRGQWVGVIGPVNRQGIVFQDHRRLVCVDAVTGETQWSRTDVTPGCDLFGDEQAVFAVPKGSTTARMFSAFDGRELGAATVPPWNEQLAVLGRRVVRWSRGEDNRRELSSVDAATGEALWTHHFAPGAGVDVDECRYVAVVEPAGRVAVVDATDGRVIVDHQGSPQPKLEEVHLSVDAEGFLVAADRRAVGDTDRVVRPFNPLESAVVSGPIFYFERESGAPRWSRPAEVLEQALLVDQPADLPFIAFAGTMEVGRRAVPGRARDVTRAAATMLILDKATGRTVYSDDSLPVASAGVCLARVRDAAAHEAVLEMGSRTVVLRYTNARRPPEPPAMAEVETSARRTSGGLLGIIRSLGEGAAPAEEP